MDSQTPPPLSSLETLDQVDFLHTGLESACTADLEYFPSENYLDPNPVFTPSTPTIPNDDESAVGKSISYLGGDRPVATAFTPGHWMSATISSQSQIYRTEDLINVRLSEELEHIRTSERPAVAIVRTMFIETLEKTGDGAEAKKAANTAKKAECGYVTFSGCFSARKNEGLREHSGIVSFDLDNLDDVARTKARLSECRNVGAVFLSVSAQGLRVLVPVSPTPKNAAEHKAAYHAALRIIETAAAIEVSDHAGQDVARASFITSDPDVHINVEAVPVAWAKPARTVPSSAPTFATDPATETKSPGHNRNISQEELVRRHDYVDRTFRVVCWEFNTKATVQCPGLGRHTSPSAPKDCAVWIDGQSSIRCFHKSCREEVEKAESKMQIALNGGGTNAAKHSGGPVKVIDGKPALRLPGPGRLISEFSAELALLLKGEHIFARSGCAFALDFSGQRLDPIEANWLRTYIEKGIVGYKASHDRNTGHLVPIKRTLSKDDAAAVLVAPQFLDGLLKVEAVHPCRMPIERNSGRIELLPAGHDVESSTFTISTGDSYAEDMTADDARSVIDDALDEFPFAEDLGRSRAVAVAAMMTVFAAGLMPRGATKPVFIYLGNVEGTGKTTLAQLAGIPYGTVPADGAPTSEEEWEKKLLAIVIAGRCLLLLDNLKGHLNSPALERYTTTSKFSGRILGESKDFCGEAGAVVLITGNHLTFSPDMRRRALISELFMHELRAEDRHFRRTLDEVALRQLQPRLLAALWALVRAWDAAGRPRASKNNASFPRWCLTIGGIVEHAGFGCPSVPAEIPGVGDTDISDIQRLAEIVEPDVPYKFQQIVEFCSRYELFERFNPDEYTPGLLTKGARTAFSRVLKNFDRRIIGCGTILLIDGKEHAKRYVFGKAAA